MTKDEIMAWLEEHGSAQTRKVLMRHGAREPLYGVKISDLKKILKEHRNNMELAIALWDTGNSDAMYCAALIANHKEVSKEMLQKWIQQAYWYMLSEAAVAGLAAESAYGWELGLEWIASHHEMIAAAGWSTLSSWISLHDDRELDISAIKDHLQYITRTIHSAPNRVRYTMNNYIISVASYIRELHPIALKTAYTLGEVKVDMGETHCQAPYAPAYIEKIARMGRVGKKRKYARC